jgi:hypothetical protein
MDRTEYPLFPLDFALRDARNRTKQATSLVEKKAVLSRIIPALTNSEAVKKGEAAKCRDFTRCTVKKAYTCDASYQYIDEDKGEAVQFKEYERRYHLFLEEKKQRVIDEKRKRDLKEGQGQLDNAQVVLEQKEERAIAAVKGVPHNNAAAAVALEKENSGVNASSAESVDGRDRGVAEDKASFAKSSLHDAMWANIAALSSNLKGHVASAAALRPRAPLAPLEPSSPKKERSDRGTRRAEGAPEMKRGGPDDDDGGRGDDEEGEEDTVDFRSLRVSVFPDADAYAGVGRVGISTLGTGLSSPAEMPSPTPATATVRGLPCSLEVRNDDDGDGTLGVWAFSTDDEEHVFTASDAAAAGQRAQERLEHSVGVAQSRYRWDLVGIELMSRGVRKQGGLQEQRSTGGEVDK